MPFNGPASENRLVKKFKGSHRVFVYLVDGDTRISFWSGTVDDFADPNPSYRFIQL